MSDLIIKAGLVVDGTGATAKRLDIRVRGGRITEMAADLRAEGEKLIDAGGAIVAPGFIDSHTHFDATIYWDPMLDPMPHIRPRVRLLGSFVCRKHHLDLPVPIAMTRDLQTRTMYLQHETVQ